MPRYFDPENIAYWLAFQLLTGNTDTQSRNVYLYSPQNSDCWYLLDWDNDGMLRRKEREIIQFSDSEKLGAGREQLLGQCAVPRAASRPRASASCWTPPWTSSMPT